LDERSGELKKSLLAREEENSQANKELEELAQ